MTGDEAMDDMVAGYRDGLDLTSPEPSGNRSNSYRHGWLNGRDDKNNSPRAHPAVILLQADSAISADMAIYY